VISARNFSLLNKYKIQPGPPGYNMVVVLEKKVVAPEIRSSMLIILFHDFDMNLSHNFSLEISA
jgi:hypothetical protein